MNVTTFRQRLKPWMLPIAMLGGVLFHDVINAIAFLAPYLIFVMLLITFCRVRPSEFRITRLSWMLIAVQTLGAIALYLALLPVNRELAEGTFICVFCPTATAAPVITGMLGGSVPRLATFSIVSNVTVAIAAPLLFTMMGSEADITFLESVTLIATRVVPLIILPLFTALALRKVMPRVHAGIASHQSLSFHIWAVSLFIVVGRAVRLHHGRAARDDTRNAVARRTVAGRVLRTVLHRTPHRSPLRRQDSRSTGPRRGKTPCWPYGWL